MYQQIVVKGCRRTAPLRAVASRSFRVACHAQSFVDNRPLYCREVIIIHRHIFLSAPSETAVVNDDVLAIFNPNTSTIDKLVIIRFSQSTANITDNQIIAAAQVKFGTSVKNTVTGSRLSGNGYVCQFGTDVTFQLDDAAHTEHDGGIFHPSLSQCPAQ